MENIQPNLSIKDYHSCDAIGSTDIKNFIECPAYFKIKRQTSEVTKPQQKGILLHTMLLQPEELNSLFDVAPVINKNTLIWRKREEYAQSKKLMLITEKDLEEAVTIVSNVKRHPVAKSIFDCKRQAECSFFSKDIETSLTLKARPDLLVETEDGLVIVDYKTTSGALDNYSIQNYFRNYKVEIQASFHSKVVSEAVGEKVKACIYIIQSTINPELVRCVQLDEDLITTADFVIRDTLNEMATTLGEEYTKGDISINQALMSRKFKAYDKLDCLTYQTYYTTTIEL
jgi:hypothetical protein